MQGKKKPYPVALGKAEIEARKDIEYAYRLHHYLNKGTTKSQP